MHKLQRLAPAKFYLAKKQHHMNALDSQAMHKQKLFLKGVSVYIASENQKLAC